MIRITIDNSRAARLTVEGNLSGRDVEELRRSCAQLDAPAVLDLAGVVFADRTAAVVLNELADLGFLIEGGSGFVDQLMRENRPNGRMDADERRLIELLRSGDEGAYELVVRRYGGRMLSAARRILQNEADARDAVQEAFLSAFRGIGSFAGEAALGTWLHRIVVNAALMQVRSRKRRCEEPIEPLLPRFDQGGNWAQQPCTVLAVEGLEESTGRLTLVRDCIDRLPERYRTVLLLRDIEDLDTEETARLLNATPTAVKVRLHRARQALKTLIECEIGVVANSRAVQPASAVA